nr:2-keto-3-deoxygluconate transporter [Fredinandcohnia onubensis]
MKIKKTIDRIPGGLMVVPLFIGALLNTFFPNLSKSLGSFTFGLTSGTVPILAVWFVCLGASIRLKSTGVVLRKSGVLLVTKLGVAWVVGFVASHYLGNGMIESGFFAGVSALALVAAMDMTNTGLYASLMDQYGTKEEAGAFVLMNLESGPLMTMIILGTAGVATFEPQVLVGLILPFIVGYILGNLDEDIRDFLSRAIPVLIPFFAFSLGNGIKLTVLAETGLFGIILGLLVIVVTGIPLILADIFVGKGNGTAGIAASSTAGAAVATPLLVAEMVPEMAPVAPAATALVATSLIVTSIVVPIVTGVYHKIANKNPILNKRMDDISKKAV